jgi:multidrug resistance efflux pump
MIAFLVTIYAAIVLVLFKFKILKPRPYPITCTLVAGVFTIGAVTVAWMLCAPMSMRVVSSQYVIALVPYVKGQVKRVVAKANQPLKKGDLLLEIDPAPYQYDVNQLEAQLDASKENVKVAKAGVEAADANVAKANAAVKQARATVDQAKAGVASADAGVAKAKSQDDLAKTEEQIALNLQKSDPGSISVLKVAEATQKRVTADATVRQAEAGAIEARAAERQTEASLVASESAVTQAEAAARQATFTLKAAESTVPAVAAQLDSARFNLAQCRMLAPTDGYVVVWAVQEGTMLVSVPLAPAGTFVNTEDTFIVAAFPQNYLLNVRAGDYAEVVLDPYPGRLFKAKVETVIEATGEGQFAVSGTIPSAAKIGSHGMFAVKIRLDEDSPRLPLGAGGTVAVYTDQGQSVHIISKVAIRMKKWLLFVLPSASGN